MITLDIISPVNFFIRVNQNGLGRYLLESLIIDNIATNLIYWLLLCKQEEPQDVQKERAQQKLVV